MNNHQILGKVINGDACRRANEEQFVIATSHGIAISDAARGNMILKKAEEKNVGTMLPLLQEVDILR